MHFALANRYKCTYCVCMAKNNTTITKTLEGYTITADTDVLYHIDAVIGRFALPFEPVFRGNTMTLTYCGSASQRELFDARFDNVIAVADV